MTNENQTPTTIALERFQDALPPHGRELAGIILRVAEAASVDPCILAAIIAKESDFGATLRDGCGDWVVRGNRYAGLKGVRTIERRDEFPEGWTIGEETGPWVIPEDGLGWKRGLMHIDWGLHRGWIEAFNWRDPTVNITFGASLLARALTLFAKQGIHDPRLGIAAYSTSIARVLVSVRSGNPDSSVPDGGYSAGIIELAETFRGA